MQREIIEKIPEQFKMQTTQKSWFTNETNGKLLSNKQQKERGRKREKERVREIERENVSTIIFTHTYTYSLYNRTNIYAYEKLRWGNFQHIALPPAAIATATAAAAAAAYFAIKYYNKIQKKREGRTHGT